MRKEKHSLLTLLDMTSLQPAQSLPACLPAWLLPSKGQLISETIFLGLQIYQKANEIFERFLN